MLLGPRGRHHHPSHRAANEFYCASHGCGVTLRRLRAARVDQTFRADLIDRCGAAARAGLIDRSRAGSDIARRVRARRDRRPA